jgi:hypothetical protein
MTLPQHAVEQTAQGPTAEMAVIPLPAGTQPVEAPAVRPNRVRQSPDRLLTVLVLVLAFLVASFPARNSDVWFHLATGRLLAHKQFAFGTDPFAYTTAGAYWASHSWLFDLGSYFLYEVAGGAGLVVFKALLVAALAALLLALRRPGADAGVPAVCTTLAILAMSPRLLLQPACVSYFFLGLTLWLLCRPHATTQEDGRITQDGKKSIFLLLIIFAAWANFDEWFFLGPLLVALVWVGERLQGERRTPWWLIPAGLAACLLNPHTFHIFMPPAELSTVTWSSGLRQDVRFQALFGSPWQPAYLNAAVSLHAAALAYFCLTTLGLLSFLLNPRALRGWQLCVWLPFALFAAWQARAIPFFAIVAAPITALNIQDFIASRMRTRLGPSASRSLSSFILQPSPLLLVPALVALIILAWPGWLAGIGREGPHIGWDLQAEPSLRQAAETLHEWREKKLLAPSKRAFAVSLEIAHYGAWFCPGEKHFFDHRYNLFGAAALDYETVCRALQPGLAPALDQDWRRVLRENGIGVVIFYDREPQRLLAALNGLAGDPENWTLLHIAGQALIAGWNEARPAGGFGPLALDAERLAFGPQDERARRELPAVPARGPGHLPPPRDLWTRLASPAPQAAWESAAATTYLHYFDDTAGPQSNRQLIASLNRSAASLVGLPALRAAVPLVALQVCSSPNVLCPPDGAPALLTREHLGPYFSDLAERPPALPLLAVRAARRAIAANPQDANAWLRLGQAYLLLRNATCERSRDKLLPLLTELRNIQIASALEQALRLDPELESAHHELTYLYGERHLSDQALVHRREELRLTTRVGPRRGETVEDFRYRVILTERDTAALEEEVAQRREDYAENVRALQGGRVAQAGLALRLGLARVATDDVLLPCPAELLGSEGMKLQLALLLSLGRVEEVGAILGDERVSASKEGLQYLDIPGPKKWDESKLYGLDYHLPAYEWLRAVQAAAIGNYAEARGALGAIRNGLRVGNDRLSWQLRQIDLRDVALLPGLFCGPPPFLPAFFADFLNRSFQERTALQVGEPALRAHQADLCVLEGLLALEQGAPEDARSAFLHARRLCAASGSPGVAFAGESIVGSYLSWLGERE